MSQVLRLSDVDQLRPGRAPGLGNLPAQLTTFIGREREQAEVVQRLSEARLITLTGAGGCGKTRLALRVAVGVRGDYADGTWFIDLAPLIDPSLVPIAIAAALEVREQPGRLLTETLISQLQAKTILLLLDNCEHLIEGCAPLVEALLRGCEKMRVLASSRQPLNLPGEVVWRVPSLALPDPAALGSVGNLGKTEAIRLFVERASASQPHFTLTEQNAAAVADICRRLDGIPLAIELAAARVRLMPVAQIQGRLDDRFQFLTAGARTSMPRQRTLRGAVDWSYELLTESERHLFDRLSVFAGGFRLEAAQAVCDGEGIEPTQVLELVSELIDKSMVSMGETAGGIARYGLLETLREYGQQRLVKVGRSDAYAQRHARHMLTLAREAAAALEGSRQAQWLARLDEELDNIRVALQWSLAHDPESALGLASNLADFWFVRGYFSEGGQWLNAGLETNPAPTAGRAKGLLAAGTLALQRGDLAAAETHYQECLQLAQAREDRQIVGLALVQLGTLANARAEFAQASPMLAEGIAVGRACGNVRVVGLGLLALALTDAAQGDPKRAAAHAEESLAIFRELGNAGGICGALLALAIAAFFSGELARVHTLGTEGLNIARQLRFPARIAMLLECFGALAATESQPDRALRLAGAAAALRNKVRAGSNPGWQAAVDATMERARTALGRETAETDWNEGAAMTTEQAVAYALGEPDPPAPGAPSPEPDTPAHRAGQVSRRELEIADLIARGLTNRQMARKLFISERTVESHVDHILNKLGFRSRAQIAAWVVQQPLAQTALT